MVITFESHRNGMRLEVVRGCLNHLQRTDPIDAAIRANPDMIMQRDCLMLSGPKRVIDIALRLRGHSVATG